MFIEIKQKIITMNSNAKKRKPREKGFVDPKSITVFKVYVETTLLEFLLFKMPSASRNSVKGLLSHHQVSVGGVPVSQFDYKLYPEDEVIVSKRRIAKRKVSELPIIYEDEDIIAINKPSGLLSIASDREKGKTAFRMVSDYVAEGDSKKRIFVVHRLDEDTSGVLIFAKNYQTREALQNHWQEIVSKRYYYAIVEGEMEKPSATLTDYLEENDLHLVYVSKNKIKGKKSITSYKLMKYRNGLSLLDIALSSGRKNQIRVQLGHRGHYVIGDDKYGEPINPLGRLGLHAYELAFVNPLNGKSYDLKAPMPEEFKGLMFEDAKKVETSKKPAKVRPTRDTRSATKIKKGSQKRARFTFGKGK